MITRRLNERKFILLPISCVIVLSLCYQYGSNLGVFSKDKNFQFGSDEYIRHCVTDEIIGKVPMNLKTEAFVGSKENPTEEASKRKKAFDDIFKTKQWIRKSERNNTELASGPGSTLSYAQNAMATLHSIIHHLKKQLGVQRIRLLDIPCGDMVWMSRFLRTRNDVDYTGMDIVQDLIDRHRTTYARFNWKFVLQDVVSYGINGSYDIILCRMMLQHLLNNDVLTVLKHFSDSGSRFLLTTSFYRFNVNNELTNLKHRFRFLNLEIPPISLAPPVCVSRDGDQENLYGANHFLGLWRLPLEVVQQCEHVQSFVVAGLNDKFYSCTNWTLDQMI